VFADKGGLFLTDGTIYRFLLTYEPSRNFELTRATWSDQHRTAWEGLVNKALKWADTRFQSGQEPLILRLADDAWERFSDFRNRTHAARDQFPAPFRGFIPKAASSVLRLAGLIHVAGQLSSGNDISPIVTLETTTKAIAAVMFYLGHTLEALKLLHGDQTAIQQGDDVKHIISALEGLIEKAKSQGYLSVKDISSGYNSLAGKNETPHKTGKMIRQIGLDPKQDSHSGTYRVSFDEIQNFLKTKSAKSASPQNIDIVDDISADLESRKSASPPDFHDDASSTRTLRTLKKQSPPENQSCISTVADFADFADFESKQSEKNDLFETNIPVEVIER